MDTRAIRTTLAEAGIQAPPPQGRRRDSLWNGLLIGAGIGALAGLIPDYYDDCEECHDSLYASIGVGAAIGVAVDLLRSDRRPAPPAAPNSRLRMNVTGGPKAVRIHGALRW